MSKQPAVAIPTTRATLLQRGVRLEYTTLGDRFYSLEEGKAIVRGLEESH
jgi:hypothetical protein